MYSLIVTGYDYHGKFIYKAFFRLTRGEAKVIASRYYNPVYMVNCSLFKSH